MDRQLSEQQNSFLGSGWSFPVTFTAGNYELHTSSYEKNINESINIILLTKKGERSMEPQFGSGLQSLFFKIMDETLKGEIIDAIKTSLIDNEPRISVQDIEVDFPEPASGLVSVSISYVYNQTNTRHNYVFPFHINEGTNLS